MIGNRPLEVMQIAATILIVVAKVATTVAMVLIVGHFVIKYW